MIKNAIGLIEVRGYSNAITVADAMIKSSPVELIEIQKAKGFGWITVEIEGDVGAVTAAIENGAAKAQMTDSLVSKLVLSRPAEGLGQILAKETPKKEAEKSEKQIEPEAVSELTPEVAKVTEKSSVAEEKVTQHHQETEKKTVKKEVKTPKKIKK